MADQKLTDLTAWGAYDATYLVYVVAADGSVMRKATAAQLVSALSASNLSAGTVPDARFPATLPAASGVNLTALNGSNVASGTVAVARLPTGTSSSTVCIGDDSRLSDARTPVGTALTAARIWVGSAGNVAAAVAVSGDITITNAGVTAIGAGKVTEAMQVLADNTTNNASTSAHGYLKKLDNSATNFMNGQGNWAAPTGAPGGSDTQVQFNNAGVLGGLARLTWNEAAKRLLVTEVNGDPVLCLDLSAGQIGFFTYSSAAQQAANAALTDNSGGSASTTIAEITDVGGLAEVGPVKDAIASLAARLAEIRTLLTAYGLGT